MLSFVAASALYWGRKRRLAWMLEQLHRRKQAYRSSSVGRAIAEKQSIRERQFAEKARLSGLPAEWTYIRFRLLQALAAAVLVSLVLIREAIDTGALGAAAVPVRVEGGFAFSWTLAFKLAVASGIGVFVPVGWMTVLAQARRGKMLMEIAKLSHRLSVCVSEGADIRELLLRAGRPLVLMKPYLQELAIMWGNDRRASIYRFRESIGISEVFPLANALEAISRADPQDIAKVLKEQTAGIEAALSAERERQLENAPVWISIYVMVPFGMIVLLFLYPWLLTISEQLTTSFQG
ncbi:hypothetical protein [Paenibacillus sp. YYML68]|uniref:hypothetical protein n=1 Tax=Paenibacillus sp. YYML68 TaxID=2909250 RepID=UPI0024912222|nr:hypothetical protein [Paenibacillus sp. YYML68]